MKAKRTSFEYHEGNLLPRPVSPPCSNTPKGGELVWGSALVNNKNIYETTVICFSCRAPIYKVFSPVQMGPWSYFQPDPEPAGDYEVPKLASDPCPKCGGTFARYNSKQDSCQYLTDKGVL